MTYGSVCSGIEAASVAWHPLGWRPAFFSEIERFPSAVLAHRWPGVENRGDMTKYKEWNDEPGSIDVLVGGTPCQSFSVAGLRAGMDDPRGNLALVYLGVVDHLRPRWVVWENVPGVRSVDEGRALASFLGGLAELGFGAAWRSFDAQYFGLAQRRERVFVVGYLGDWTRAAGVLFEPEGLLGDSPPSRQAGQRTSGTLAARTGAGGDLGTDHDLDGGLVPEVSPAMKARDYKGPSSDGDGDGLPLIVQTFQETGQGFWNDKDRAQTLRDGSQGGGSHANLVTHSLKGEGIGSEPGMKQQTYLSGGAPFGVRRLTPRECERLQGFPDDYTLIPRQRTAKSKVVMAKDGPRYKALGNSMAVPCMRWIGERIALVDSL
jgi:DNA (cytosine-5)-methyltransferase 1